MLRRFFMWLFRSFVFRWIMAAAAVWVAWGIHTAFPEATWLWRTLLAMVTLMVIGWVVKPLIWGQKKERETTPNGRK